MSYSITIPNFAMYIGNAIVRIAFILYYSLNLFEPGTNHVSPFSLNVSPSDYDFGPLQLAPFLNKIWSKEKKWQDMDIVKQ